jgi:hypothetical protein
MANCDAANCRRILEPQQDRFLFVELTRGHIWCWFVEHPTQDLITRPSIDLEGLAPFFRSIHYGVTDRYDVCLHCLGARAHETHLS